MTKFKIPKTKTAKPASPEELFRTLKRSARVPHLWAHQADLLRAYAEHVDKANIALELPTGGGKSLIGLLVAEFRRQAREERVAYLCPTRQLATQVHAQASEYGIPTVVLTGKQRDYDPADFNAYNSTSKIALTTYSGIFNTNPKIDNAQCILLDDAHAAENYIAGLWSVQITRTSHRPTYDALVNLFQDVLPEALHFQMVEDGEADDPGSVGIVHPPMVWERSQQVREIVAAQVEGASFQYPWSMIDEHLAGCHIYVSRPEIVIRPLCPPSETHGPFARASQRIFMSATLGSGGDLERTTGVAKIHRLPLPLGWERRGTGRRLILLPNINLRQKDAESLAADFAKRPGRVLVLTTDGERLRKIESGWLRDAGKEILHADDIEDDLGVFSGNDAAALVLTNRYDGIDLPDDACRRMVIDGHPDAMNVQERFLIQRLGAGAFLRERIRTRITQAMGRCTRNDADHATILILGERLTKFLTEKDVRKSMHPELQAELEFGISNSTDQDAEGLLDLVGQFQTDDWEEAERHLLEAREEMERVDDPASAALRKAVTHEIVYVYGAWNDDWTYAAEAAYKVSEALEGGSELRPYQALWYYIASNASQKAGARFEVVDDLLRRAVACAPALSFFLRPLNKVPVTSEDPLAAGAALRAARVLSRLGTVGTKFEKNMTALTADLSATEAKIYERGLDTLGELLGFEVQRGIGREKAAPDSVWDLDRELIIGWEAKSDEKPDASLSIATIREARGHFDWIKEKRKLRGVDAVRVIVASARTTLDKDAAKYAQSLRYGSTADLLDLAKDVTKTLSAVRRESGAASEGVVADAIHRAFRGARLTPNDLANRFALVVSLPVA